MGYLVPVISVHLDKHIAREPEEFENLDDKA